MKELRPLEHISEKGHDLECHSKKATSKTTFSKEPNQTFLLVQYVFYQKTNFTINDSNNNEFIAQEAY